MGNTGSEIYSGAASFGRVWTILGAILATIIGLAILAAGIYILVRKDPYISINAQVIAINGNTQQGISCPKLLNDYSCNISFKYTYNNSPITSNLDYSGNKAYYVGEFVTLYIKNDNPGSITINKQIPKWAGGLIIIAALFVIGMAWFWVWASRKYKFVAAAEGAGAAVNIMTGGKY